MSTITEVKKTALPILNFRPIRINDKALYEKYLFSDSTRGCELSFSNLISWGKHEIDECGDFCVLFSSYSKFAFYPYPIGKGDVFPIIEAILLDAKKRGISPIISSISPERLDDF